MQFTLKPTMKQSKLSVFWGETDANGAYIRMEFGNQAATLRAANEWLTARGLEACIR